MADGRYIAYYRVSTSRQGRSGLGLEGQRQIVLDDLNGGSWDLLAEFTEVETGAKKKGRTVPRPQLDAALAWCRVTGAVLVVAKVDRLTRDPDFMAQITEAGVDVWFCNLPNMKGPVGKFTLRMMLAVAELEAGLISERTRQALAAAKARGTKLGGDRGNLPAVARIGHAKSVEVRSDKARRRAEDLAPIVAEIRASGAISLRAIAAELHSRGIRTPRGKGEWSAAQVRTLLARTASPAL